MNLVVLVGLVGSEVDDSTFGVVFSSWLDGSMGDVCFFAVLGVASEERVGFGR